MSHEKPPKRNEDPVDVLSILSPGAREEFLQRETAGGVSILPGGLVLLSRWDDGEYVRMDVSEKVVGNLMRDCSIYEATLGDLLLIAKKNMSGLRDFLGNWCDDIVGEGLTAAGSTKLAESETTALGTASDIEYLELYWAAGVGLEELGVGVSEGKDTDDELLGLSFPALHGVGYEAREDVYENESLICRAGDRIYYGVDFTGANLLARLPIRQTLRLSLTRLSRPVQVRMTLGQVLYGVFWELSFHGPPANRDAFLSELKGRVREVFSSSNFDLSNCEPLDIEDLIERRGSPPVGNDSGDLTTKDTIDETARQRLESDFEDIMGEDLWD